MHRTHATPIVVAPDLAGMLKARFGKGWSASPEGWTTPGGAIHLRLSPDTPARVEITFSVNSGPGRQPMGLTLNRRPAVLLPAEPRNPEGEAEGYLRRCRLILPPGESRLDLCCTDPIEEIEISGTPISFHEYTCTLPPDLFARHRRVQEIVHLWHPFFTDRLRILDVGGGDDILRAFLPHAEIDLLDPARGHHAEGTGYDVVVSLDTLEHVPPDQRDDLLRSIRERGRAAIVAAPFQSEGVAACEALVDHRLRQDWGLEHPFLREHRSHGLPKLSETVECLGGEGRRTLVLPGSFLPAWSFWFLSSFAPIPELTEHWVHLNTRYSEAFDVEPAYRHFVVSAPPTWIDHLTAHFTAPSSPPWKALLEAQSDFLALLARLAREHEGCKKERDRLEAHLDTLRIVGDNRREQLRALTELRARQEAYIEGLEAQNRALAQEKAELADKLDRLRHPLRTLWKSVRKG
ncbi:MAG: hypothetical protein D6812_01625 [Deltaproteobacteria bacterium]|nr:MAG: hypothetical protein D6812_01625 [Deltaproteobacteria bacterium]